MKRIILHFIFLFLLVGLLEFIGQKYGLFGLKTLGYDKFLHFLGGMTAGFFGIGMVKLTTDLSVYRECYVYFFAALFASLVIGIGWEFLQVLLPRYLSDASDVDLFDAFGDVLFDGLGGWVAYLKFCEPKK